MTLVTLVLGVVVGIVLGLTGAGGSILAAPLLMWTLGWTLQQAAPVALLAVCAAATFGTIAAWDAAYVRHRAAMLMALGSVLTAPLGLAAAQVLSGDRLAILFAAVLLVVAARMALQAWRTPKAAAIVRATVAGDALPGQGHLIPLNANGRIVWNATGAAVIAAIGAAAGFVAGLLGTGGGFVIVPALRGASRLSMHSTIATSLLAIALISAVAFSGALLKGVEIPWGVALPFVGGALAGMLAGRKLAPRIAGARLQLGFAALMVAVAVGLAIHAGVSA